MSMYTQLIEAALESGTGSDEVPGESTRLADMIRDLKILRSQIHPVRASGRLSPQKSGLDNVADQLAYDVALIQLADRCGVEADLRSFSYPEKERSRLESELISKGIHIETSSIDVDNRAQESRTEEDSIDHGP